jgi:hypothetical protein
MAKFPGVVFAAVVATFLTCVAVPSSFGWGSAGHKIINRVAMETLPADMPTFLRTPQALDEIEYLGPEPDRWRSSAAPELSAAWAPEHFVDLELADLAAAGGLPKQRYEFLHDLNVAGRRHRGLADELQPQKVGLLPWQVNEDLERLEVDMHQFRMLQAAGEDTYGAEQAILYDAGCLGHFVGDGSQPLHTTINYNGWVESNNPEHFTRRRGIHSQFETDFVQENLRAQNVLPLIPTARILEDPFRDFVRYLRTTHLQVAQVYRFEKHGGFEGRGSAASRNFAAERLAAGATMLRDMIYTAWVDSAQPAPE